MSQSENIVTTALGAYLKEIHRCLACSKSKLEGKNKVAGFLQTSSEKPKQDTKKKKTLLCFFKRYLVSMSVVHLSIILTQEDGMDQRRGEKGFYCTDSIVSNGLQATSQ